MDQSFPEPRARFLPPGEGRKESGFGTGEGLTSSELLLTRVRVVRGEAWIGKTTFAKALARWRHVPLVELNRRIGCPTILEGAQELLVLDGLDEAVREEPGFGNKLVNELKARPTVHVVITCRTVELQHRFLRGLADVTGVEDESSTVVELAPWTRVQARSAVDALFPSAFDLVVQFAIQRGLTSLLQFPRAVLALAELASRGELAQLSDEASAWRAVLASLMRETNPDRSATPYRTQRTSEQRLRAIARVAAQMSMAGIREVKLSEAPGLGVHLAELVQGEDLQAASEALGVVGVSRAPGVFSIEPANVRDWLVAVGLDDVSDENVLSLLTPLEGKSLGIFLSILRLRPGLRTALAERDQLLDLLEPEAHAVAQNGIVVGDSFLEGAPDHLADDINKRVMDEDRPELVRASLLSMVDEKHGALVAPSALKIALSKVSPKLRHEALRIALRFGSEEDVKALLAARSVGLTDEEQAWIAYEAVIRKIAAPKTFLWELGVPSRDAIDYRRMLGKEIADELERSDILDILRDVVARGRWPFDDVHERVLEFLNDGATEDEISALVDVFKRVGRDERWKLDNVMYQAQRRAPTRRLLLRRWILGDGVEDAWILILPEDVEWLLTEAPARGARLQKALEVALGRTNDGNQREQVIEKLEALSPGARDRLDAAIAGSRAAHEKWLVESKQREEKTETVGRRVPLSERIEEILAREETEAERFYNLIWTVVARDGMRDSRVEGRFADLADELKQKLLKKLLDGLVSVHATPPPAPDATRVATTFLLQHDLLRWLLSQEKLNVAEWMTSDVVEKFLPGFLGRSYGRTRAVVDMMFSLHCDTAIAVATRTIDEEAKAGLATDAIESLTSSVWEIAAVVDHVQGLLLSRTAHKKWRLKALSIVAGAQPAVASDVAEAWVQMRGVEADERYAAIDALLSVKPAAAIAAMRELDDVHRKEALVLSTTLGSLMNRGSIVRDLSLKDAADAATWLEELAPGPDFFESGEVGPIDSIQRWKGTFINLLWVPFRRGDRDAEKHLDELSTASLAWLRPAFERDRAERRIEDTAREFAKGGVET